MRPLRMQIPMALSFVPRECFPLRTEPGFILTMFRENRRFVPEQRMIRTRPGAADVTGKICVIGSGLNQDNLEKLFKRRNGNGQ